MKVLTIFLLVIAMVLAKCTTLSYTPFKDSTALKSYNTAIKDGVAEEKERGSNSLVQGIFRRLVKTKQNEDAAQTSKVRNWDAKKQGGDEKVDRMMLYDTDGEKTKLKKSIKNWLMKWIKALPTSRKNPGGTVQKRISVKKDAKDFEINTKDTKNEASADNKKAPSETKSMYKDKNESSKYDQKISKSVTNAREEDMKKKIPYTWRNSHNSNMMMSDIPWNWSEEGEEGETKVQYDELPLSWGVDDRRDYEEHDDEDAAARRRRWRRRRYNYRGRGQEIDAVLDEMAASIVEEATFDAQEDVTRKRDYDMMEQRSEGAELDTLANIDDEKDASTKREDMVDGSLI